MRAAALIPEPSEPDFPRLGPADAPTLDAGACQRLWGEVLIGVLAVAAGGLGPNEASSATTRRIETDRCREWIGSPDFVEVATLAGFDAQALHDRLSAPGGERLLAELGRRGNPEGWRPAPRQLPLRGPRRRVPEGAA